MLPHAEWAAACVSPAFVGLSYARETSPEVVVLDMVANCVILEHQDVMASYVHAFDTLRSASLTPRESVASFGRRWTAAPQKTRNRESPKHRDRLPEVDVLRGRIGQ
ncbi:Scr1 family TA system antitoxin-like transcriptional regulator [Streptomyces sp. NPDC057552]|uniref:Scr1 family TA system antitoxin-like transcriptional regulator n=1 Tax=Streptomyces sp. NPDC057552 TaxID=3350537 RepID=UPI0036CDC292